MSDNHLVIGLGGTGGKIIRSLRKQIFENFRAEDPSGVNVRYLYVDSSDEMMGYDDPTWKILGQSVQLKKTSQLLIAGLNLSAVLDNVSSYPGISPWLGDRELFKNIIISANAANVVGGQRRRLGRFLFACVAHTFREQVQALVKEMETGGVGSVTFHVCCGLAGGTGSGSIVDVLAQLRDVYPGKQYRVLTYCFIPDKNPGPNRALANYHANGYAALLELNALSCGSYRPWDVTGTKRTRLELQDPFNGCYLFSDENEAHHKVDVDRELPDIVASFLYQKIVAARDMSWDSLDRMESYENMDFRAEESASMRNPERSRMFFAFGIKQIAYPEEEIREYLTYAFARQASLQLQYNRWSDSFGYLDEAANQAFGEFVQLNETKQRWHLTDEHLCLSEGILPDEIKSKRWKPINAFWSDLLPNFKSHVRESHARNDRVWLDELARLCETAFGQNYRDLGVRKFYETKRGEIKDHVRELRGRIEADLFADWLAGGRSMYDIGRLVMELVKSLEERLAAMDDRIAKTKESEQTAQAKVSANVREWAQVGVMSGLLGKRQSLMDAQGECLQMLYIYRTRIEGWEFAKKLLQSLIAELNGLGSEVGRAASMIADALKEFTDGVNQRCADAGQTSLDQQVIRFYNPAAVKDFAKSLVLDHDEQKKQANAVRSALAALLGESLSFSTFNNRITRTTFVSVLEATCERSAIEAHNNSVATHAERGRILQVSVIERLYREYAGNPEGLRAYVMTVVGRAKNYLCFNDAEVKRQGPGTFAGGSMVSTLAVILPEAPELTEFRERLRQELRNATPGAKDEVSSKHKPNEITLVSLTSLFPLRFVADARFLKEKYEQRIAAGGAQARMELHGEGDGTQFADVFIGEVDGKKYLAYLMIARAMGLIQQLEDPETGLSSLYLLTRDSRGRDLDPLPLGKDLNALLQEASLATYDSVISAVHGLMESQFLHKTRRDDLISGVLAQVDEVKAQRKNPLDKVYKAFVQASQTAEEVLLPRQ